MLLQHMSECGYTDPMPYWDWTRNANSVSEYRSAPIFDPSTGFGGPSTPEGNNTAVCVDNGPYSGMQVRMTYPNYLSYLTKLAMARSTSPNRIA